MSNLSKWILDNSSSINLRITELSWPQTWGFPLHDIAVEITYNNRAAKGRGKSADHETAFLKAFSESVERATFKGTDLLNTNGMAAHPQKKIAIDNAIFELIERDAFLCHYLTSSHIVNITKSVLTNNRHIALLSEKLLGDGVEIIFAKLYTHHKIQCVICLAFGAGFMKKPFGVIVGLGCHKDVIKSYQSSFYECIASLSYYMLENQEDALSPSPFSANLKMLPEAHRRCGYHQRSAYIFRQMLRDESSIPSMQQLNLEEVSKNTYIEAFPLCRNFKGAPLHVVGAKSDSLQNLFFGKTIDTNINFKRLSAFAGRNITNKDINFHTIPIG